MFRKAERTRSKIKIAITGPSGSGKTYSALKIAAGLGGKIALIDTENGSASLYAQSPGMPAYDVLEVTPPYLSTKYEQAIKAAAASGYDVLIIDSITHQWSGEGGILDRKEKEQQAKPGLNGYTLWAKYTPEHEAFKACINNTPIHVIATMRSKQDYVLETNEKGKTTPRKVGLAPVQREGAEYEFTTVFDLAVNHYASVSKDRTGLFDGQHFIPSEETGKLIGQWLASAPSPVVNPKPVSPPVVPSEIAMGKAVVKLPVPDPALTARRQHIVTLMKQHALTPAFIGDWLKEKYKVNNLDELTEPNYQELCSDIVNASWSNPPDGFFQELGLPSTGVPERE